MIKDEQHVRSSSNKYPIILRLLPLLPGSHHIRCVIWQVKGLLLYRTANAMCCATAPTTVLLLFLLCVCVHVWVCYYGCSGRHSNHYNTAIIVQRTLKSYMPIPQSIYSIPHIRLCHPGRFLLITNKNAMMPSYIDAMSIAYYNQGLQYIINIQQKHTHSPSITTTTTTTTTTAT